jgi:hypothetical protein
MAHVRHGRAEAHILNQPFGILRVFYTQLWLPPPHAVTICLYLFRQKLNHQLSFNLTLSFLSS